MDTNCFYFMLLLGLTSVLSVTSSENKGNSTLVEHHQNVSSTKHNKRIRSGQTIDITEAKYYVYILCGNIQCGGTLVRRNKVITAAHCVDSCNAGQFEMAVGLNAVSEYSSARRYRANSITIHPKYRRITLDPYDAAVITLTQNVDLNNKVALINYASNIPPVQGWLTVVGYGLLNINGPRATRLQRAQLRIIQNHGTQIETEVVGTTGPSTMSGDSGGPAVFNSHLVGIVSGYRSNWDVRVRNVFVAVGNPEIFNFIRNHAP